MLSNNMRWELRSHVTCRDINVIYYLKFHVCDRKETHIGKTVGDNVVGFKKSINESINTLVIKKKLYFQLNIMMKLKETVAK